MNAPERSSLWILPEGAKKASMTKDDKIQNAATFQLRKEDHTMGNLLRHQLLRNDHVHFAGYQLPHPLEQVKTCFEVTPYDTLCYNRTAGSKSRLTQKNIHR